MPWIGSTATTQTDFSILLLLYLELFKPYFMLISSIFMFLAFYVRSVVYNFQHKFHFQIIIFVGAFFVQIIAGLFSYEIQK